MKGLGSFGAIGVSGQGDEKIDYIQLQKILNARCRVLAKDILKSRRLLAANQLMKNKISKNIDNIVDVPVSMIDAVSGNVVADNEIASTDEKINGYGSIKKEIISSDATNGHKILFLDLIKEETNGERESKSITAESTVMSNEIMEILVIPMIYEKEVEKKEEKVDSKKEENGISSYLEKIHKDDAILFSISVNQKSPLIVTESLQTTLNATLGSHAPSIPLGDSTVSRPNTPGHVPMNVPIPRCVDLSLALLWQDIASQALLIPDNYQQKETFDSLDSLLRDAGRFFSCNLGESDSRWPEFLNLQKVHNRNLYTFLFFF